MKDYQIYRNIQKHIALNETEKRQFEALLTAETVSKKELLLEQGQLCRKLYFVESGSLRAYNINEEGRESTIMFAVTDWWITDMNCFVNEKPALLSIEALEDSRILALHHHLLESLYTEIPKFERFFRILFQRAYIREQLRALQSISLTTEERYWQFLQNYPQIVEKVTQKQIASYLGVTPEFLSTIKKKKDSGLKLS